MKYLYKTMVTVYYVYLNICNLGMLVGSVSMTAGLSNVNCSTDDH